MKTLHILSFAPVLLFGPIFWLVKFVFYGKRAILTFPLCLVMAYGILMAHVLLSEREGSGDLAETSRRAHTVAAASEPSAPPADAELGIHGEVVQSDDVKFFVATFDPQTGESTGNAIVRNCGPINPDAPAVSAPRGDVVITKHTTRRGGDTYHLRDANGNHWLVASGHCPDWGDPS